MALVIPLTSSAEVIENILFKVRRGIALSRNASQANSNTGVMVDLPEKIDFEMTLLKTYQSSSFQRATETTALESGVDSRGVTSSELSLTSKGSGELDLKSSSSQTNSSSSDSSNKSSAEAGTSGQSNSEGGSSEDTQSSSETITSNNSNTSTENNNSTQDDSSTELEQRCTNQDHHANRQYDKFDTDTGKIEGISI